MKDEREVVPQDTVAIETMSSVAGVMSTSQHGIEVAVEFKPVEHPLEPLDIDQPIQCPLPEPSILNVSIHTTFNVFLPFACKSICFPLSHCTQIFWSCSWFYTH